MRIDIQSLAAKHGFSADAVSAAWNALRNGRGSMAQFRHCELGGGGQWMPGMLMIGDMFNHSLKARVDNLFHDLQNQLLDPPASVPPSQHTSVGEASLSYESPAQTPNTWYPAELGFPSTTGSQNNVRYAWFPGPRRLAIELFGQVTLYDTGAHTISGVSQGQSNDSGTITFTSQFGVIPVSTLPVVE